MTKNRLRTQLCKELTRDCMINNRARTVCLTWKIRLCLTKVNQYFAWKRNRARTVSYIGDPTGPLNVPSRNIHGSLSMNRITAMDKTKTLNAPRTMNRTKPWIQPELWIDLEQWMNGIRPMNGTKTMFGIGAAVLVEPHRCCVPELWMWIDL
jgi:hypothetical protein